jgi:hypothetical protein
MDSACKACHDGALHQKVTQDWPSCTSCHSEHHGKDSLVVVSDNHCLNCHSKSIDTKSEQGRSQFDAISGFGAGLHPAFAIHRFIRKDPSHIVFPHQLHGAPRNENDQFEKLECSFCHEPDESRRLTKPVNYDRHCARCHPLRIELGGDYAPHVIPNLLRSALQLRFLDYVRQNPAVAIHKTQGATKSQSPSLVEADWWVNSQTRRAEDALYGGKKGCPLCHTGIVRHESDLPEIPATSIPIPWLSHARFNHDSHRMLTCLGCHETAPFSSNSQDILIPSIAICETCHNKQGASTQCVSCHSYHNRASERVSNGSFVPRQFGK